MAPSPHDTNKQTNKQTEDSLRLEISDLGKRGIQTVYVAKTKVLICAFAFAYAKSRVFMTRLINEPCHKYEVSQMADSDWLPSQ